MKRRAFALLPILLPLFSFVHLACGGGGNTTSGTTTSSSSSSSGSGGSGGAAPDPFEFMTVSPSCAYDCPPDKCAEQSAPYPCQNLGAWEKIPHASECGAWDGKYPPVTQGKCTATMPSGEALKYAGKDPANPSVLVMPDGRRLTPAGSEYVFPDPESQVNNVIKVPGKDWVITVDLGYADHILRVVDPAQIALAKGPVLSQVDFKAPESLNQGVAFSAPDRVFVAGAQGVVQALTLDLATGALARDDARSIPLPASPSSPGDKFYSSGVAVSADNARLFVSGVKDSRLFVADITAGGPAYGTLLGTVDLGAIESYNLYVDPHDPSTQFVYATMWASSQVVEVDVSNPAAPKVARAFKVDKDPQGLAFLDARWMVVGNDLGDTLSLIDRVSGTVTAVPAEISANLKGIEPSSLTYDEPNKRLYVTQAGYNALSAFDVDLTKTPPTLAPAGRLPTAWWPSGVAAMSDGSLVVTTLMGHGTGPRDPMVEYELLHGSIQRVPKPSMADLTAGEAQVAKNADVAAQPGYPQVSCPPGVEDFPVPPTNTGKPSPVIDHVFLIVRENKTFDGIFGDFPGVVGDPTRTLLPPAEMDGTWTNVRALARTFAHSDNFYTSAFISTQGHLWATHGRTDDFNEREWPVTGYGRSLRGDADSGGVNDVARPAEGSLFDWLGKNMVPYDVLGEIVGVPSKAPPGHNPFDLHYPGGIIQNIGYPDVEKSCYVAGRVRVICDTGRVVYMTLPNDHTRGVSSSAPSPETMFAVNDEATGMMVSAVSHSPLWKSSLVIVIEDDPAQGGESVDYHRTILVMASPWMKRKYVSHTHLDVSSIHKLIAHIYALPYPNIEVAKAALPLDMFTGTPDYTPYDYAPRSRPLACGSTATAAEEALTASWEWDDPDEQPGLDAQVERWLRKKQLTELSPARAAQIERRRAGKKRK